MVDFRSATVPDRFSTADAHSRLDAEFGFSPDQYSQDWDIELADASRLQEFVDAYFALDLDEDERFTLMELIVASADDALHSHKLDAGLWGSIHNLLVSDSSIHACTIHSWCCANSTCEDEEFPLSPRIRAVWCEAFD
jgi:hypothetical protein